MGENGEESGEKTGGGLVAGDFGRGVVGVFEEVGPGVVTGVEGAGCVRQRPYRSHIGLGLGVGVDLVGVGGGEGDGGIQGSAHIDLGGVVAGVDIVQDSSREG